MGERLSDRVAVVTGGAAGIGGATVRRFAEEGADVVVLDRYLDAAQETANSVEDDTKRRAFPVEADVGDESDVKTAIDDVTNEFDQIDILVNNAAIRVEPNPVTEMTEESWEDILSVNLKGIAYCCKHVIPHMTDGGAIVNISSVGETLAREGWTQYDGTKGAINAMTRDMACDHADQGIRVNAVAPGSIVTDYHVGDRTGEEAEQFITERTTPREDGPGILKRHATPDECASAILFLASEDASFVTGMVLGVDGGKSAYGW